MRFSVLAALCGLIAMLATACTSSTGDGQTAPPISVGKQAPDFSLSTPEGNEVSLSSFRSKRPVLLYFSMGPG